MLSLGETVVGSSDNLSKKILPFDRKMSDMYIKIVLKDRITIPRDTECFINYDHRDIGAYFVKGTEIKLPFSVEDLLSICIKNTIGESYCQPDTTTERCSEFVFEYLKYIVQNKKAGKYQDFGIPTSHIVKDVVEFDLANIPENIKSGDIKIGDKIVTHGYLPEQLPRDKFDLTKFFIKEHYYGCKGLEGKNGIKKIHVAGYSLTVVESRPKLADDDVLLNDINEYVVAGCEIKECMDKYKKFGNQCVPEKENVADENENIPGTYCIIRPDEQGIAYAGASDWALSDFGNNEQLKGRFRDISRTGDYEVTFDAAGVVSGTSVCSDTEGSIGRPGNPEIGKYDDAEIPEEKAERNEKVRYCWCQVTSHEDSMGHDCNASKEWVFMKGMQDNDSCRRGCAESCASEIYNNKYGLRNALMGKNNPI